MKLVIFDCDGTLVDSQNIIVAAMRHAFDDIGLAWPGRAATLSIVGLSLVEAMRELMPLAEAAVHERLAAAYRDAFFTLRQDASHREPMFDGARDVLDALAARADVVLGIATGKSQRGVRALLEREGLERRFATIQTADDAPSKPHPAMILQAMAATGIGPAATTMIGDTSFDMAMARSAGVGAVGVSWGYHAPERLRQAGSHAVIDHFRELDGLLAAPGWVVP